MPELESSQTPEAENSNDPKIIDSQAESQIASSNGTRGKPFEKGNKLGRGSSLGGKVLHYKNLLLESYTDEEFLAHAEVLKRKGNKGDVAAILALWDRLMGKPAQAVEHSGPEGGAIQLAWPESPEAKA